MLEMVEGHDGNAYRAVYTVRRERAVCVLHAFQKESPLIRQDVEIVIKNKPWSRVSDCLKPLLSSVENRRQARPRDDASMPDRTNGLLVRVLALFLLKSTGIPILVV